MAKAVRNFVSRNYPAIVVTLVSVSVAVWMLAVALNLYQRFWRHQAFRGGTREIVTALHDYHDEHGHYPPAKYVDESGTVHSWRSLVKVSGSDSEGYTFSEPWNSPTNQRVAGENAASRETTRVGYSVLAVVGDTAAWAATGTRRRSDFGSAETILIMVVKNAGVEWFEPRDLLFDGNRLRIEGQGDAAVELEDCYLGLADGSVRSISKETPPEWLNSLLTRDGDDNVVEE